MTAKNTPGQQNRVWPPSATDYGVAAAEPLLKRGDLYYNTGTSSLMKCDNPSFPATWAAAGASASGYGGTLYVDKVRGNDSTGARGDFSKPFLTVGAAVAASSNDDVVEVGEGLFAESTLTMPGGVTRLSIIGRGAPSVFSLFLGSPNRGTTLSFAAQDGIQLGTAMVGFSLAQLGIITTTSGVGVKCATGGTSCMQAGLVLNNVSMYTAGAPFDLNNIALGDFSNIDIIGGANAIFYNIAFGVMRRAFFPASDCTFTWDGADAAAPSVGRNPFTWSNCSFTGVICQKQFAAEGSVDCAIAAGITWTNGNSQGGNVPYLRYHGDLGNAGQNSVIDFSTLPDVAAMTVDLSGAVIRGDGAITFALPSTPTNTLTVDLRDARIDDISGNPSARTLTIGNGVTADLRRANINPSRVTITLSGTGKLTNVHTSGSLSTTQNDYDATGFRDAEYIRLNATGNFDLTGLAGGQAEMRKVLINIGASIITVKSQNTGSAAGNRFAVSGIDIPIPAGRSLAVSYDPVTLRWRPESLVAAIGQTGTPAAIAGTGSIGTVASAIAAPFDHVHAHGAQTDGTMHAAVIASGASGFMTGADKAKLDLYPATPPTQTLFAWNETDTTQFQISKDEIASGTTVLSVQTPSRNGSPRLRIAFPTKVTGEKIACVTVTGIDLQTLASKGSGRFRYVFEYTLIGASITLAEWYATGPLFLCADATGASFYALGWGNTLGTASRGVHVIGGTVNLSGSTPGWRGTMFTSVANTDGHDKYRVIVEAVKNSGSQPFFVVTLQVFGIVSSQQPELATAPVDSTWNTISAFSTNWNSVLPKTIGFFVLGGTGTTTNQYFEYANIRVTKHPLDVA